MKSLNLHFFIAIFLLVIYGCSADRVVDTLIKNVRIVDVKEGVVTEPLNIAIDNGTIVDIGKTYSAETVIDCTGKYVIPGLFDCHTHLANLELFGDSLKGDILKGFVKKGVMYVRDVGGPIDVIDNMSNQINSGDICGPEIFYTGPMLESSPLTWERQNARLPDFTVAINSKSDADSIIDILSGKGATMIKTFKKFKPELYRYIVTVAHKHGLRVVHDPGGPLFHPIPVDKATEFGANSIEHAKALWPAVLKDTFKYRHDSFMLSVDTDREAMVKLVGEIVDAGVESVSKDKIIKVGNAMVRYNVYMCPTFYALASMSEEEPDPNNKQQVFINKMRKAMHDVGVMFVSELNNVGVNMLVGQDNIKPEGTVAEMKLMKEAGISDIDILRGATILPARWLGIDNKYGSVGKGKKADILILNSNPLVDIDAVANIHKVVHRGKFLL
jgi:hypothetical protein